MPMFLALCGLTLPAEAGKGQRKRQGRRKKEIGPLHPHRCVRQRACCARVALGPRVRLRVFLVPVPVPVPARRTMCRYGLLHQGSYAYQMAIATRAQLPCLHTICAHIYMHTRGHTNSHTHSHECARALTYTHTHTHLSRRHSMLHARACAGGIHGAHGTVWGDLGALPNSCTCTHTHQSAAGNGPPCRGGRHLLLLP